MEDKSKLLIAVIFILLIILGFIVLNQQVNNSKNQVKVGATTFSIPNGFYEGSLNSDGDVNITNGYDTFFLKECGKGNMTKYIKDYKNYKNNTTKNMSITNFTVDNTLVYKSTMLNESYIIHYWFKHDGIVYSMYTWSGNKKSDTIVSDLIKLN